MTTAPRVQRQRRLPMSKAVEIAYKQIRMRLSRSLLVTSGIVLAIAFLIAIQINDLFADGMRGAIDAAKRSPEAGALRAERAAIERRLADNAAMLRTPADQLPIKVPTSAAPTDVRTLAGGRSFDEVKEELGPLPAEPAALQAGFEQSVDYRLAFRSWVVDARRLVAVRAAIAAPAALEARLADNGVPTRADDIANARVQNRWLLGLALLVAFVGILNAMLMSVTERFREIGTMKCLGALDSFIVKLFVIESLFQGVVGTAIGLALGAGISVAINAATYGTMAFAAVPIGRMLGAIATSAAIGIALTVAGAVWPAWQAARMHPIEAMRVEA